MVIETNFTRFPNELLQKLMTERLSSVELRVILTIVRRSYGFHKGGEILSITAICELTGIARSSVAKAVRSLLARSVLIELEGPSFERARLLSVNPRLSEWKTECTLPQQNTKTVSAPSTPTVSQRSTPTYYKENYKRNYKIEHKVKPPSYDKELYKRMIERDD